MASPWVGIALSVAAVSVVSLVGAFGLSKLLGRHRVMMGLIALAAGTLVGDAFLHLLPESSEAGFSTVTGAAVLGGFLLMFGIEMVLRRGHSHAEATGAHDHHVAPFGWLNLVGDALHNFLDGIVLAVAFLVDAATGFATTVAVLLHEVPQELGDFAVLIRSGMARKKALLLNLASALFAALGAFLVFLVGPERHEQLALAVPVVAGMFIYIAAADLIPELHHHGKGRDLAVIISSLVAGIAIMGLLLFVDIG